MSARPFKLKRYLGGIHGTVAPTLSFATREARDKAAGEWRRKGWMVSGWRAASPPPGAPR